MPRISIADEIAADEVEYEHRILAIRQSVAARLDIPLDRVPHPEEPAPAPNTGWTAERQRAFVEHLAAHGCVSHAARAVGLSRQSAYRLRDARPRSMFTAAWAFAIHRAHRLLREEAVERALHGTEVPVIQDGVQVGTRIVHNDRLLMFLIAQEVEPPHPDLKEHELSELWPTMLANIEAEVPSSFTDDRIEELGVHRPMMADDDDLT